MKTQISLTSLAIAGFNSVVNTKIVDSNITDVTYLNYALTIKHLENELYRQALAAFTPIDFARVGFPDPFYEVLREVAFDEATHVDLLTENLGSQAVKECTYSFPVDGPVSFVEFANILEGVGVSALLGSVTSLSNKTYLGQLASIMTVEARHNSWLRSALHQSPTPKIFDTPLTPNAVLTLLRPYFKACPSSNPQPPFKGFSELKVLNYDPPYKTGDGVVLSAPEYSYENGVTIYAAFLTSGDPVIVTADVGPRTGFFHVVIPPFLNGQVYVVLTKSATNATDETIVAGPAIIEEENPVPL